MFFFFFFQALQIDIHHCQLLIEETDKATSHWVSHCRGVGVVQIIDNTVQYQ